MDINSVKDFFDLEDVPEKIALFFHMKGCSDSQIMRGWAQEATLGQEISFLECDCINLDARKLALSNGIEIIPTLIIFENGKEAHTVTGLIARTALHTLLGVE